MSERDPPKTEPSEFERVVASQDADKDKRISGYQKQLNRVIDQRDVLQANSNAFDRALHKVCTERDEARAEVVKIRAAFAAQTLHLNVVGEQSAQATRSLQAARSGTESMRLDLERARVELKVVTKELAKTHAPQKLEAYRETDRRVAEEREATTERDAAKAEAELAQDCPCCGDSPC